MLLGIANRHVSCDPERERDGHNGVQRAAVFPAFSLAIGSFEIFLNFRALRRRDFSESVVHLIRGWIRHMKPKDCNFRYGSTVTLNSVGNEVMSSDSLASSWDGQLSPRPALLLCDRAGIVTPDEQ